MWGLCSMKDDIRKKTCIIIRKNGKYLVSRKMSCFDLRWSESRNDAWRTRDRAAAEQVARVTGGIMVLFNPIVQQTKVIGA